MEARRDGVEPQIAVLDHAGLDDPAETLGRFHEEAVVRADQDVTPARLERHGQPFGANAWVDDRHVRPDRHVGQGEHEARRAVTDGEPRHLMVDVDHVGVGRNAEHHAATDRRRGGTEVAEEGDDRTGHAQASRILIDRSTVMPSRPATSPWLSANEMVPKESSYRIVAPSSTAPNVRSRVAPTGPAMSSISTASLRPASSGPIAATRSAGWP